MVGDGAFSHKIDYIASKSHHWFKSYGNFAEWVDFAYWWSFSGGGSAINGATPSSFYSISIGVSKLNHRLTTAKPEFFFSLTRGFLQLNQRFAIAV